MKATLATAALGPMQPQDPAGDLTRVWCTSPSLNFHGPELG
jgi:hypothetical protein